MKLCLLIISLVLLGSSVSVNAFFGGKLCAMGKTGFCPPAPAPVEPTTTTTIIPTTPTPTLPPTPTTPTTTALPTETTPPTTPPTTDTPPTTTPPTTSPPDEGGNGADPPADGDPPLDGGETARALKFSN